MDTEAVEDVELELDGHVREAAFSGEVVERAVRLHHHSSQIGVVLEVDATTESGDDLRVDRSVEVERERLAELEDEVVEVLIEAAEGSEDVRSVDAVCLLCEAPQRR